MGNFSPQLIPKEKYLSACPFDVEGSSRRLRLVLLAKDLLLSNSGPEGRLADVGSWAVGQWLQFVLSLSPFLRDGVLTPSSYAKALR